jgi:hypothetical protein
MKSTLPILIAMFAVSGVAFAQEPAEPLPEPAFSNDQPWPEASFEIFRLEPGQHEAFVRSVAQYDKVSAAAGLPPSRLYFHSHGDDWDVLILKVVGEHEVTPEMEEAMAAKTRELGLPTGPAYFVQSRKNFATHTDTQAIGPVSAAQWLARLDEWRKENIGHDSLPPED